jgi:hypothetical protein
MRGDFEHENEKLSMKRSGFNLFIVLMLSFTVAGAQAQGRKKPRIVENAPVVISEANAPAMPQDRVEIVKAAEVYKISLRQLLAAREAEATEAGEKMAKLHELYQDGLISRLQLEEEERKLVEVRHKVEETRKQLAGADSLVVESLAQNESSSVTDFEAMPSSKAALKKVAYIRFKGTADWSRSEIGKVETFYRAKFKKPLPVSVAGQSETHTRLGYDHRNAVDVGVHPDSTEGRALMTYLSGQNIPFMAFRRAVPGSSTGPHIHIGKVSQKSLAP